MSAWRRLDGRHRGLLILLGATTFFDGYDTSIIALALKQIRVTFHLTQGSASLWLTFLYLGALPALFLTRRADVIGRRRVLLVSVTGYTIATAATAFAPTMPIFVGLQFVGRLFLHAEHAVVWTIVAEELPAEERGFGFGVLGMMNALGVGFGAILYGGLLRPMGVSWRAMYLVALPPLLIVAALRRRLPETKRFILARDAGALADRWHRIFRRDIRRPLILVLSTMFLFQLAQQGSLFALDFLQSDRGLSATSASFMLVAAGLPGIPIMVAAGSLSDRYGRRVVGCSFGILSLLGVFAFFWLPGGIPILLPTMTLVIVGQLAAHPVIASYTSELFPTALRGQASAWAAVARVLGSASSLAVGGVLLNATGSLSPTVSLLAIGPLIATLMVAFLFPDTHGRELEEISESPSEHDDAPEHLTPLHPAESLFDVVDPDPL